MTNEPIVNTKIIYSKKLMIQLLEQGFSPVETIQNPLHPEFYCWRFKITESFQQALDLLLGGEKGHGKN